MSYLTQSQANRPAAIAGVVAIHAGLAAILLAGLAVVDVVREPPPRFIGIDIKAPPPPEPDIESPPKPEVTNVTQPIVRPIPLVSLPVTTPIVTPIISPVVNPGPITLPDVNLGTGALQAIQPVQATPRNDPGGWVTDADYRSRWIREERFGTASFRLDVGSNGRVSDCLITRSTGHTALDRATCALITKRARFKPATNSSGTTIAGIYESSIRWVLPD